MTGPGTGVLDGILVLDFSTLLPGPLATLMLAECGARVIKIERPEGGDPMRGYEPKLGRSSVNFALLNRGKESLALDLKRKDAIARLRPLIETADILIEQFRPGVMARLGLGYDELRAINPRLVYCSITGYGQTGPLADRPGHDLNYLAETGCLDLSGDPAGDPIVPPLLAADVAGGAYPAVINILLALMRRAHTGEGCRLDIAMAENLFPFLYWALGEGFATGTWPKRSESLVTGGSPRYRVYRAKDGHLAVGAIEEPFWRAFLETIGLAPERADDAREPEAVASRVAEILKTRTAAEWEAAFKGRDVCVSVVRPLREAVAGPEAPFRHLFGALVEEGGKRILALPLPLAKLFRDPVAVKSAPALKGDRETP